MKSCLLLCMTLAALSLQAQVAQTRPPAVIPGTETFTLHSKALATDYHIRVYLPYGYENSGRQYPVLYLLDGDHAFAYCV